MDTSSTIYAALLGAVQGITEFLPVSSSGHLIIVSELSGGVVLPLTLNVALHVGTLGAVLAYFWRDWLALGKAAVARAQGQTSFESQVLIPGLIIGTIPAGVLGLLFEKDIEATFHHAAMVAFPLALVGVLLWWFDRRSRDDRPYQSLTIKDALIIGLAQACALIPGTSRSGATIIGGRILGLSRQDAARFSFLLGTPAMGGAALLKAGEIIPSLGEPQFYIGLATAFLVGILTIKYFLKFLKNYGFFWFMIYRLLLALVITGISIN